MPRAICRTRSSDACDSSTRVYPLAQRRTPVSLSALSSVVGERGIGGNVARRFAASGYTACVVLRTNAQSLQEVTEYHLSFCLRARG